MKGWQPPAYIKLGHINCVEYISKAVACVDTVDVHNRKETYKFIKANSYRLFAVLRSISLR